MKSFEERKNEIRIRSEKRLQKRQQNRRILLTCLPLFLCLSLISVWLFLDGVSVDNMENATFAVANDAQKNTLSGYIIWEGNILAPADQREKRMLADAKTVNAVIELLALEEDDFIPLSQADQIYRRTIKKEGYTTGITGEDVSCSRSGGFVIKIVKSDGMSAVCRFSRNLLWDEIRDEWIALTDEQTEQLIELLKFY